MGDISTWFTTAAGNNTGSTPDYPIEGMAPSAVNDTMRENMAAIARWYADMTGRDITTAGTGAAYTLTTTNTHAALGDQPIIVFEADRASSGDDTLNVDGLGAKTIKKRHDQNLDAGDIEANQVCVVAYSSTDDTYQLLSPLATTAVTSGGGNFPNVNADVTATDEDMNSVLTPYAAQRVELGGDFTAGEEVVCERIGNTVTITSVGAISYTSQSTVTSSAGVIPSSFRPTDTGGVNNVVWLSGGTDEIHRLQITDGGTLEIQVIDPTTGNDQLATFTAGFSITYVITGSVT